MKYKSRSDYQTREIAKTLAKNIPYGIIALSGELGAGKTTFVQGFAKSLGIKDKIISPTFVLIRQHSIPNSNRLLYHIDLYRLDSRDDLKTIGLAEVLSNPKNIILIEWAEKAEKYLPKKVTRVEIKKTGANEREIIVS